MTTIFSDAIVVPTALIRSQFTFFFFFVNNQLFIQWMWYVFVAPIVQVGLYMTWVLHEGCMLWSRIRAVFCDESHMSM